MTLTNQRYIRLVIATAISLAVAGLVFVDDFPIPILAAILVPLWISVSGRSNRPAGALRLALLALAGLILMLGVLVFVFAER
ncbi:MAG: hypothetical protein HQ478_05200 [Chloroflexi bacterium]|nr:hypothetical protein [Chloroflexota bacterium]